MNDLIKLNLASGQRPFPKPWTNIDIRNQGYEVDVLADVRKLDMYEENSVDVIVAHHVLEHFDMSEVGEVSKEWHRVLKHGGKLAVFVPNAKELASAWLKGAINDYIFNVNMYGAYQGYPEDLHRWSYHYDYLIQQMGDRWSNHRHLSPDITDKEPYIGAEVGYDWWILAIEFIK